MGGGSKKPKPPPPPKPLPQVLPPITALSPSVKRSRDNQRKRARQAAGRQGNIRNEGGAQGLSEGAAGGKSLLGN